MLARLSESAKPIPAKGGVAIIVSLKTDKKQPVLKTECRKPVDILVATDLPLITFIDIEASGLGPNSYPIELGWSDTLGNGEGFLICPLDEWSHWDPVAASIHGIARDELFKRGLHVVDAADKLNDMLGFETVFCDALDSDRFWLNQLFAAASLEPSFQLADFYQLHKLLSDEHMLSLQKMLKSLPVQHRAEADAARYASATVASYQNFLP